LIKEDVQMTIGKAAALTAGLVGAIALGVAIAPTIRDSWSNASAPTAATDLAPSGKSEAVKEAVKTERPARAVAARAREFAAPRKKAGAVETVVVSMWEPELRDRVKAVLNPGAKPEIAAADFASAEEFMTVAHAARNTQVPFMVLKHRVLNEGRTLSDAIHEYKPELNAKAEVRRARAAARADLNLAG
jgi:hypothetical protein